MKNSTFILLCMFCLFISGCTQNQEKLNAYHGENFVFKYPKRVDLIKRDPKLDFYLIGFKLNGRSILNVYVGNHPNLDKHMDVTKNNGIVNGLEYTAYTHKAQKEYFSKDILIELPDSYGWPTYLHFWYKNITKNELNATEKIINSVEAMNK